MNHPMNPFDFDPNYLNDLASTGSSTQIESLALPELMKNQHVQTMYKSCVQASEMQQSLWKEITRLNAEVSSLQEKHQQSL